MQRDRNALRLSQRASLRLPLLDGQPDDVSTIVGRCRAAPARSGRTPGDVLYRCASGGPTFRARTRIAAAALGALQLALCALPVAAATLADVQDRGRVRCGVAPDLPGFAEANSLGAYSGFDVDFCRAVAAAVLGDDRAIEAIPTSIADRFDSLAAGKVDLLSRNTTWTLERNALHGEFVGTIFHDGQAFMVPKRSTLRTALQLDGSTLCVSRSDDFEAAAKAYFQRVEMSYRPAVYASQAGAFAAYVKGECDSVTGDRSALAALRSALEQPATHVFLPESITRQPRSPMVRAGDTRWENIVRWTLHCLINAEELGITSGNTAERARDSSSEVRLLLGIDGTTGFALGIRKDWCASIVSRVGNYGELYERHLGLRSPLGLERGINALWTNGGLLTAPPLR